jgi:hypothetical protein
MPTMRLVWFSILALIACLLQHGPLATWWWAPDLTLALAAWAMVDGDEEGVPLRAGLVGLLRDLVDPGSTCFYLVVLTGAGLAFLVLRSLLFRSRWLAWWLWAAVLTTVVGVADLAVGGPGDLSLAGLPLLAAGTAFVAVGCGWLLGGLPGWLRPIARAGA